MSMRSPVSRTKRGTLNIALAEFGWRTSLIATLRHSTLPWSNGFTPVIGLPSATPLAEVKNWGTRDRLSLTGQFAAHLSFLRRAGIDESAFDPGQWVAVRKRGGDARLLRVGADREALENPASPFTLIGRFAASVASPALEVLSRSWGNADSVYAEVLDRLLAGASSDLTWLRDAATGSVMAPGPDSFQELIDRPGACLSFVDDAVPQIVAAAAEIDSRIEVHQIGQKASPLEPFSAVDSLRPPGRTAINESEITAALLSRASTKRILLVVGRPERFDRESINFLSKLAHAGEAFSWLVHERSTELVAPRRPSAPTQATRPFIVSPSLELRQKIEKRIFALPSVEAARQLETFVRGDALQAFLREGTVPAFPETGPTLSEPVRSYLAALAIFGLEVQHQTAIRFMESLGYDLPLSSLAVEGLSTVDSKTFRFVSETVRSEFEQSLSSETRRALARVAASLMESSPDFDMIRCALLHAAAGNSDHARTLLESQNVWATMKPAGVAAVLRSMPDGVIDQSPHLLSLLAQSLISTGTYNGARRLTARMAPPDRALTLATAHRRLGNYERALENLAEITAERQGFAALILKTELLRLKQDLQGAAAAIEAAGIAATGEAEKDRLLYERAMLTLESQPPSRCSDSKPRDPYLRARLDFYLAIQNGSYEEAASRARFAMESSGCLSEEIDATLDHVYALFMTGDWKAARQQALRGLTLTEETEGDRAAGGFLFTYGYLCADQGLWAEASDAIERLRSFYDSVSDGRRVGEIDLLAAHLFLGRGDYSMARRYAAQILTGSFSPEIREAGAQILDEADWAEGKPLKPHSGSETICRELRDRQLVIRSRVTPGGPLISGQSFSHHLAAFETQFIHDGSSVPPPAQSRSEELRLLRSLAGLSLRVPHETIREHGAPLSSSLIGRDTRSISLADGEITLFRAVAERPFPFEKNAFGDLKWRFATRNRLGQWIESGSLPPLTNRELESRTVHAGGDWICEDESTLLQIEGLAEWPAESRLAISSLFQLRFEHHKLQRMIEQERVSSESRSADPLEGMIGDCAALRALASTVTRIAKRDVPVCILGESGTGKELVARGIHRTSSRRGKPFTAVNCAALPENLVESELFGHVRGAFTGAERDRAGLIEATDGGTLFLDEIGELPLGAQAKLLRVLQEGEFRRVGDVANRKADVRIVAATNRKLEQAVDEGLFREDLYYRIRGIELMVPSLRARGSDVLLLARHFLTLEHQKHRVGPDRLSPDCEALFGSYNWPGNVRELQNTIRGAHAVAGEVRALEVEHLPERLRLLIVKRVPSGTYYEELVTFRKSMVERSLAAADGNQSKAARSLGMSRQALAYQVRELGILLSDG